MDFFRKREIKKPQKSYQCELCCQKINGKHFYLSGKNDDFYTFRAHIECFDKMEKMCGACEFEYDCDMSVAECFLQLMKGGE